MVRKWMCLLWAMALVCSAAGRVEAAEQQGTVRIVPQWCASPVSGGTVSVRYVGEVSAEGYYLTDGLANWSVDAEDMASGDWIEWVQQGDPGNEIVQEIQPEEGAVFAGLKKGVYLVQQLETDWQYQPFKPFFLTVPEGENWDVYRAPKVIRNGESPRTADRPAPIIGAMGIGLSAAILMVLADSRKK